MLMETLGIIPPGPAESMKFSKSRERKQAMLTTGGEYQPRHFYLQGRLKFGSDTVKELKCLSPLLPLIRPELCLGPSFYECTNVKCPTLRADVGRFTSSIFVHFLWVQPHFLLTAGPLGAAICVCVCGGVRACTCTG